MLKENSDLEAFLNFEVENNCFEYQIDEKYIWDIIRYDVFSAIDNSNKRIPKTINNHKTRFFKLLINLTFDCCLFIYYLIFKNWEYLFFSSSRNKFDETEVFDQNIDDISNKYKKNTFFLESFERNVKKTKYNKIAFNPIGILKQFFFRFLKKENYSDIISLIKEEYNDFHFTNDTINEIVNKYKIELFFYNLIFKIKSPKIIFVTQNGIQKALFSAAKQNNIPLVEVQHGRISDHIVYSYSDKIDYRPFQIHIPTYLFVFSTFWKEQIYYPVKQVLEIGNSFFYDGESLKNVNTKTKEGLVVVSNNVFGPDLKNLIIEMCSSQNIDTPVYFKLHPNQFSEKKLYQSFFLNFDNVKVIASELNMSELLSISKAVLVINSTTVYEALHRQKVVTIYKKQTYLSHKDVFDNPNVYLVSAVEDLIVAINNNYKEFSGSKHVFFKDFDDNLFNNFMNDIGVATKS